MLLILTFFIRHNLTKIALVDLLQLINLIIGVESLPESHYKFMKICSNLYDHSRQFYCSKCELFIGNVLNERQNFECENCASNKRNYFLYNSIEKLLTDIIYRNYNSIIDYKNKIKSKPLADITQGKFLKIFENIQHFSISFNLDGVSIFSSNLKKSFWPIIVTINDLPPKLRYLKQNMIVAGLWYDVKVNFNVFLKPFINELNCLYEKGIECKDKIYKIISGALCVDSVARCKLLKMKQFNGKFGCTYCKHPGNLVLINGKY